MEHVLSIHEALSSPNLSLKFYKVHIHARTHTQSYDHAYFADEKVEAQRGKFGLGYVEKRLESV